MALSVPALAPAGANASFKDHALQKARKERLENNTTDENRTAPPRVVFDTQAGLFLRLAIMCK
ncbi:hypothetical protein, partial [uncultured Desulfovibrio sp.]|uniref:hypothetical protein n=1 Tax=uncultured Desulfovibrio sp. TaxID=167968 RepID=UPI002729E6F9